ncbi:MAG: site-2 protease family protein [Opitutaceae bacterium]|nr:site-2 protease family protein [Opitutaceae bacterium]
MNPTLLREGLIIYLILVTSLSIHEWAHAWTADKLGDDTPRSQGRVTLNPIAHMDLLGTVILPLTMVFLSSTGAGFFLLGWGKPVMVNSRNFRKPVRDDLLTTIAGPLSNIALCLITALIGGILLRFIPEIAPLIQKFIFINALLAVFNLIPIPPLDGSHILRHATKMSAKTYYNLARWGLLIMIVLINAPLFRTTLHYAIISVATPFLIAASFIASL